MKIAQCVKSMTLHSTKYEPKNKIIWHHSMAIQQHSKEACKQQICFLLCNHSLIAKPFFWWIGCGQSFQEFF